MKETVIYTPSSTQKVMLTDFGDGNWLISKLWRKSPEDSWKVGKGIMLPADAIHKLGQLIGGCTAHGN